MRIIDWLLEGDVIISYLTTNYLLDDPFDHNDQGYIGHYLDLYDSTKKFWGRHIYSGKWTSSTYTLLELKYMEIHKDNPIYQEATKEVLDGLWFNKGKVSYSRYQDMCMAGMLLSLVSYGKIHDYRINEIIDYVLAHQMKDGGWNCAWDSTHRPSTVGSVHTTISVLEALEEYEKNGYRYRLETIQQQTPLGQEYLLRRNLFKSMKTGEAIHQDMISFHYPFRWKYDCFRGLEYFVNIKYPYDPRMQDALNLVKSSILKGYVLKGKRYSGKIHFPLESGRKGRFNTYRALRILKYYDNQTYQAIISADFVYN